MRSLPRGDRCTDRTEDLFKPDFELAYRLQELASSPWEVAANYASLQSTRATSIPG
jgi:hypothetical protein